MPNKATFKGKKMQQINPNGFDPFDFLWVLGTGIVIWFYGWLKSLTRAAQETKLDMAKNYHDKGEIDKMIGAINTTFKEGLSEIKEELKSKVNKQ